METTVYKVDPRMIPPVVIAMAAGVVLLGLEGFSGRGLVLLLILLPFLYLGAEILARRITLDPDGITISKFLRTLRIPWSEVQALDALKTGHKLFVIIHAEKGRPVFLTNTIQPFDDLAGRLLRMAPREKISEGVAEALAAPPTKHGPRIQAWLACAVLTGIVVGRLLGYG